MNKKLAEQFDHLQNTDKLYMQITWDNSIGIVLHEDEIYNIELLAYCDKYRVEYSVHHNSTDNKRNVILTVDYDEYFFLTDKFPHVKELYIAPDYVLRKISKENIKTYYETLDNNHSYITVASLEVIPPNIRSFFTHSYSVYKNTITLVSVFIPDLSTYNKLILLLGGRDDFCIYQASRK